MLCYGGRRGKRGRMAPSTEVGRNIRLSDWSNERNLMKSSSALRSYTAVATAILLPLAARSQGQAAGERPQFEVASIKLNNGCQNNRNPEPPPRPGRLQIGCVTLQNL